MSFVKDYFTKNIKKQVLLDFVTLNISYDNVIFNSHLGPSIVLYDKDDNEIISLDCSNKIIKDQQNIVLLKITSEYIEKLNEEEFYNDFKVKFVSFANKRLENTLDHLMNKYKEEMINIKFNSSDFYCLAYTVPDDLADSIKAYISINKLLGEEKKT